MTVNTSCLRILANSTICGLDPYLLSEEYAVSWLNHNLPEWKECVLPESSQYSPLETSLKHTFRHSTSPSNSMSTSRSLTPKSTPQESTSNSWPNTKPYLEFKGKGWIYAIKSSEADLEKRRLGVGKQAADFVEVFTDAYFLHEGSKSKLPNNTVIHYSHSEGIFKSTNGNIKCKESDIGWDGPNVMFEVKLQPGEYKSVITNDGFSIYLREDKILVWNMPLNLHGVLKVNGNVYNDPEIEFKHFNVFMLYINKTLVASADDEIRFDVAADEVSPAKQLGAAESLMEAHKASCRAVEPPSSIPKLQADARPRIKRRDGINME